MNILILTPTEEILNKKRGGAISRWIGEVYSRFFMFNTNVLVCGRINDNSAWYLVKTYNISDPLFELLMLIPFIRRLCKYIYIIKCRKIIQNSDIIIIHNEWQLVKIVRFFYKGKIFLHMHNNYLINIAKQDLNYLNITVEKVITCSNFLKDGLIAKDESFSSKTITIYNGVDTNLFKPYNLTKENAIAFVGRIDENKGLHIVLEVYKNLILTDNTLKLYIAGNSVKNLNGMIYFFKCMRYIKKIKNNGGNINFLGHVPNSELPKIFNKVKLVLGLSTRNEAFGMIYIESLACKTAVFANNIGGVEEAVSHPEMLVNNLFNFPNVLSKINNLLYNDNQRTQIEECSFNRVFQNFDWQSILKSKYDLLALNNV